MRAWMITGAIASCAWATTARAEQCAVLDDATAARAADVLHRYPDIVSFCEPCGDVAPAVPARATRAATHLASGGAEVLVDGRPIGLAYTYVKTSNHRYDNLAALVGCPTTGVSPSLAIDDASPTGVLIHASRAPVREAEPIPERAVPPSAPAPAPGSAPAPAPASAIYIITSTSNTGVGWGAIIAACSMTTLLWWLGAAELRRHRRRRAMRPRATEL